MIQDTTYKVNSAFTGFIPDKEYDVNVAILIHFSPRYAYRLNSMKRCGLVNRSGLRVHVTLLGSKGDSVYERQIRDGWPEGIDVTLLDLNNINPVPKINGYYLWLRKSQLRARWHLRVDDDSVTDLGALCSSADGRYKGVPIHLMCSPVPEDTYGSPIFSEFLESKGIEVATDLTEYESSLTSAGAMEAMFSCPEAVKFLEDTASLFTAPGDRALAFSMHVARVPVAGLPMMSKDFLKAEFSLCGGGITHIHYVDWADNRFYEMLEAFEFGTFSPIDAADLDALSEEFLEFGRCLATPLAHITLLPDGTIHGASHANESLWRVVNNSVYFSNPDGYVTTIFRRMLRFEDRVWAIGEYLHGSGVHYIRLD